MNTAVDLKATSYRNSRSPTRKRTAVHRIQRPRLFSPPPRCRSARATDLRAAKATGHDHGVQRSGHGTDQVVEGREAYRASGGIQQRNLPHGVHLHQGEQSLAVAVLDGGVV